MNIKHGFYRRSLDAGERRVADRLKVAILAAYRDIDSTVDAFLLEQLVTNFVKAMRREPRRPGDHNLRDAQTEREQGFRAAARSLGLTRVHRLKERGSVSWLLG